MNFLRKPSLTAISLTLFLLMACNAPMFVPTVTPSPVPPAATSVPLSQQVTLISVPFNEADPGAGYPPYTLAAQIPQLTGTDDPRVLAFNQRLEGLVMTEVDTFRQGFKQSPITPMSNGSFLEVSYTLVSQIGDLWSLKFDFNFYTDGAAHPGLNSRTLNYDLAQGRELALGDIFLPNANYLEVISTYCIRELSQQPFFDGAFTTGADPTVENYRNWNIASDGLLITFETYQVAPGAAGPQQVLVPYTELTSILDPQGPLRFALIQ